MAKRTLSYSVLNIGGQNDQKPPDDPAPPAAVQPHAEDEGVGEGRSHPNDPNAHLVKNRAQQVMLYMRPEAHKALTRYALEQSTFRNKIKPHDLLVEAVQEWFDKHGLREQVRVSAEKGREA